MPEELNQKPNPKKFDNRQMIILSLEMGFVIALPLLAFGFVGKWLDSKYGTDSIFTLLGIGLALAATTFWLYRKINEYIK